MGNKETEERTNEGKREETVTEGKEERLSGSDPQHPLPTLPAADWPQLLQRITRVAKSEILPRSDTLRKAFDHDFLSYNRRTNQEYRETKKVCLSILMSGTPLQVPVFIPTTEDGGSSRQMYYYMYGINKWVSQFADNETDWEEVFRALGLEWKKQLDVMKKNGVHTLQLTQEQKDEIDAVFSELFTRSNIANDREMYSFVARMAINFAVYQCRRERVLRARTCVCV